MNLVRNIQKTTLLASMISASLLVCNNPAKANQKACVITDAGATVCGRLTSLKPPTNNRPPVESNQVQIDKMIFSLKGCRRDEQAVKCTFEIANKGKEEKQLASSAGGSYMVDSTGTSYRADTLDMGGSVSPSYMHGYASIVPDIESFASINIIGIPTELTQAKVLEFNTNLGKKVQFRNVPILN
jgi:uncharacterized protein YjhX (UPF0386 family)